jgi:hypothetical protein
MITVRISPSRTIIALIALVSLALLPLIPTPPARSQPHAAPAGTSFSHDAHGLEKQYEPLLKAYSKGKDDSIDQEFSVFVLPDASKWFADYFASNDVQQLSRDYQAKTTAHKKGFLTITTKVLHTSSRFHAHCTLANGGPHTTIQPRADAPKPTREVPVEQFRIEFTSDDGKKFSELANFVYVDGAYRYLGNGAYPFWSMPERPQKNASGGEN